MSVKKFNTRIIQKNDTVGNLTPNSGALIPLLGEIVVGKENTANTADSPYIMKVGDGTHTWAQLPVVGPTTFYGVAPSNNNPSGAANQVITVAIPKDRKVYSYYKFVDGDDTQFTLNITGGDYLLTEHYILLDNSSTEYDRLFDGITIAGINSSNVFCQREWLSAGDILEVKISIYKISSTMYATVTAKTGFTNGGNY